MVDSVAEVLKMLSCLCCNKMKYQIELKVHGQKFDLNISDADFALYLNCTVLEDFEIESNNSRLSVLRAYVKSVYELYLQDKSVEKLVRKIELLT